MSNPICPACGESIEQMDFRKSFLFIDGVRYVADLTWVPGCCGALIIDEDFGFTTDEVLDENGEPKILLSTLRDDNGAEIMRWFDTLPECEFDEEFYED